MDNTSTSSTSNIKKLVLSGGPCGGKTTGSRIISERLKKKGYRVYCVPEAANLVATGGGLINIGKMTVEENIKFQCALTQYIMDQEERFLEIASIGTGDAIIICDRGCLDNRAYCPKESWDTVMKIKGQSLESFCKRYDAILHMTSTADGAEEFYTLENNASRYEDVDGAKKVDSNLKAAWECHPNRAIISNGCSFEEKCEKAYSEACRMLKIEP